MKGAWTGSPGMPRVSSAALEVEEGRGGMALCTPHVQAASSLFPSSPESRRAPPPPDGRFWGLSPASSFYPRIGQRSCRPHQFPIPLWGLNHIMASPSLSASPFPPQMHTWPVLASFQPKKGEGEVEEVRETPSPTGKGLGGCS